MRKRKHRININVMIIANIMESSTFSIKEEFVELLEDKPDLLETQEITIMKDNSTNSFINNSFWSADVKSEFKKGNEGNCISPANQFHTNGTAGEKKENTTIPNRIRESSSFSIKEEFVDSQEDKPDLVDIQEIKIMKDEEHNCISPGNQFHTNQTTSEKEENIWSVESDENRELINKHEKICLFCLRTADTSDYVLFNEMDKEILEILLTNVEIKESASSVICSDCTNTLQEVFAFKSSCQYTEDSLTPFINPQNLGTLDISTVFHEIRKDQKSLLPKNTNICRFCLEILEKVSFTFLKDLSEADLKMLKKVMPEMQLEATKEPLICEKCLNYFKMCFKFIGNCLNALKQCRNSSLISLNNNLSPISFSQDEIKIEENDLVLPDADSENSRNPDDVLNPKGTERKCDEKLSLARHMDLPKGPAVKIYKCDKCPFQTKYRSSLGKHNLIHEKLFKGPEAQLHKCDVCPFQTIHKRYLKVHNKLMHKPEEVEMHKCDKCPYQTKYRHGLRNHIRRLHDGKASLMESQEYECDSCSFRTKYKMNLQRHCLTHDKSFVNACKPSKIQLYYCDVCLYETVHKEYLKTHKLLHKKPEEVEMRKCDKCPFQTKYKQSLNKHSLLMHKKPEDVELYKCQLCPFSTRYKQQIGKHQLVHKDVSEIEEVFQCAHCLYVAKKKSYLKDHVVIHMDVFYDCEFCTYKTRYKKHLSNHLKQVHNEKINPALTNT